MACKKHKTSSLSRSILTSFLAILSFLMIIGIGILINQVIIMRNEINSVNTLLLNAKRHETAANSEADFSSEYIRLSEKAEQEMDRLVSTVGILATVYTIFGALIVFKSPHEIDKRIEKIDSLVSEVKDSALEASYQADILDAVIDGYNEEKTNYDKIRRLSKVIEKYPDRPDAYIERGFIYDNMRRYDDAITDYKIGLKTGANKSTYYNSMGVAYNKKGEYKKAISFYTKAIDLDKDDASQYANRGSCYDDMHEFEKALDDYRVAIKIDDGCKEAYINRSVTLKKQIDDEKDITKKEELYNSMIADLQKALELDPDDASTKRLLRNSIKPRLNPDAIMAKIDERIGDLELESKNYDSAFKQYVESCNYYLLKQLNNGEACLEEIERLVSKVFSIDPDEIAPELPQISTELSSFCQGLRVISVLFYKNGSKEIAEKAFIILSRYDSNKGSLLNLSYMKRRHETKYLKVTTSELLDQYGKTNDAIWCTNKALCYVSGVDDHEVNWQKAIEVMNMSSENVDAAVSWWEDTDVVGASENNMAMILFSMSQAYSVEDIVPLSQRIKTARLDGYIIPTDIDECKK